MTTKTIILIILICTLLSACNRHWVRMEDEDKFVWKKIKSRNVESVKVKVTFPCEYKKTNALNVIKDKGFNIYEYDSIRIYIRQDDTILNDLTLKGYIQGQYFFTDYESNKCNFINWENPVKVEENGWTGYHIYLSNLREIVYGKPPRMVRKKWPLTKVFRFSFRYSGQPFINPSVFRIEIENSKYKMGLQDLDMDKLLDGGKMIWFYQFGVEI